MKKMKFILSCIIAVSMATAFQGCSSDDSFPAPTVDAGSMTSGSIDLSDGTTFDLPVNIKSEGGLRSVLVQDSEGNTWAEVTSFQNPNSVTSIPIDFANCTETKALILSVTAIDNAGQTTKSKTQYSLNVYVPVVYISADPVVTLTANANLNVRVGRGVKNLATMTVKVNDGAEQTIDLASEATAKTLLKSVALSGLVKGKNTVTISVFEAGATAATAVETCDVNRAGSVQETIRFKCAAGKTQYLVRRSEETGNVEFIKVTPPADYDPETIMPLPYVVHFMDFTYNANNMVTVIDDSKETHTLNAETYEDEVATVNHTYKFAYNAMNELTGVTYDNKDYVTDVVYENGQIASYKIDGKAYSAKYKTVGTASVRTDILDAALSGYEFNFDGTEEMNPYYNAGLPAVIPGNIEGLPLQVIYSPYLFKSATNGWNKGWTSSDGDLSTTFTLGGVDWTMQIYAQ